MCVYGGGGLLDSLYTEDFLLMENCSFKILSWHQTLVVASKNKYLVN